jgi:uncharacterized protein YoxC
MSKVTLAIAFVVATLPLGVTAGQLRVTLSDASGATPDVTQDVDGDTAEFDGVADGSYIAKAQRLAADGSTLGDAVQQTFTVDSTPQVFNSPSGISVTVAPE